MSKSKTRKPFKSGKTSKKTLSAKPSPQEINALVTLFNKGQYTESVTLAQSMTVRFPLHGLGWKVLGAALTEKGMSADALAPILKAVELSPDDSEVYSNLGNTLLSLGRPGDAEASYRLALEINPNSCTTHYNLGNILRALGRLDEAKTSYQQALEINPNFAEAHGNLGSIFHELERLDMAKACYQRALEIKPNVAEAHYNLGNISKKLAHLDDAKASFRKAHQLGFKSAYTLEALMLPTIMGTRQEMLESRMEFERNLDKLIADNVTLDDLRSTIEETNFYLAFHGLNDRDLQIKVAKYYEQARPSLLYTAPHCTQPKPVTQEKIRIGFLSKFLYNHSVSLCFSKIIEILSLKGQYEVTLISSSPIDEKIYSEFIGTRMRLPNELKLARQQLAELELDILVYLDIGMEPLSYFLAFSRLARTQCVLAGHPVTTGIANMDYFLSTSLMEPPDATEHYSEKLALLPSPLFYFAHPVLPATLKTHTELGLPEDRHIYMCPMRLQKLHPDFDEAISRILQLDANGIVVLFEDIVLPFGKEVLIKRFKQTIPTEIQERIVFLPWVKDSADFINTIAAADVILDPFHFGIGSTAIMIYATGTPLVTKQGAFLRGRVGAGFCKMLDLTECIAEDTESYAQKAVEIANDQVLRKKISTKILQNNSILFENLQPIEELIDFFDSLSDQWRTTLSDTKD